MDINEIHWTIQVLPVRNGDCIFLRFADPTTAIVYRVLIDMGYPKTYHKVLKPLFQNLINSNNRLDLVILTHIDNDHIGGLRPLLADFGTSWLTKAWLNFAPYPFLLPNPAGEISIKQGIAVRDHLSDLNKLNLVPIIYGYKHQLGPSEIQVLSPDQAQFDTFIDLWKKEEIQPRQEVEIGVTSSDHQVSVEELANRDFIGDESWSNRSSIATLITLGSSSVLLTSDSHPHILAGSLQDMGYTETNRLQLQLMQVAHHGSKGNTNDTLMTLVDCQHFFISTNGKNNHQFPHKEALSRIIVNNQKNRPGAIIHFYFTYNDPELNALFSGQECQQYNLICHFPSNETDGIILTFP